jgi:hypothetical protein
LRVYLPQWGEKLADVALRYSLGFEGTTCVGCSSLQELDAALGAWRLVRERREGGDERVFKDVEEILAGE